MREVIPIIGFLNELITEGTIPSNNQTKMKCKVFEYNLGVIELARLPKMRPRTIHINIAYYHFCSYIVDGSVVVEPISIHNQIADLLTKPLPQNKFLKLQKN